MTRYIDRAVDRTFELHDAWVPSDAASYEAYEDFAIDHCILFAYVVFRQGQVLEHLSAAMDIDKKLASCSWDESRRLATERLGMLKGALQALTWAESNIGEVTGEWMREREKWGDSTVKESRAAFLSRIVAGCDELLRIHNETLAITTEDIPHGS